MRAPGLDAGFDGGAHIVDVRVHVVGAGATDDDNGVAENSEPGAERTEHVRGSVEEILHLVAELQAACLASSH